MSQKEAQMPIDTFKGTKIARFWDVFAFGCNVS